MERLETEQPIFQSTDILGKEPQRGFVDPSVIGSPNPYQTGQSSLPELGPELVPIDASQLLSDSTLFNTSSSFASQRSAEPYQAAPGIDALTGIALTETPVLTDLSNSGLFHNAAKPEDGILSSAVLSTQATLQTFFNQPDWQQTFQDIFGKDFDQNRAQGLAIAFAEGDFSALPPIEILSASTLNGASGGFDTGAGKIYLSDALLSGTPDNVTLVKSVLLEEIGHYIDAQINRTETLGDEGEYFADRLQGINLSDADLLKIKTEDDLATIWLNGSQHQIEQATTLPNFAIRTQGTLRMNGGGDLDGDPLNLQDDALIYATKGFIINGNVTLPVQYNANGNVLRDASGKAILAPNALTVGTGYTSNTGPSNSYAGVNPPTIVSPLTVDIPLYGDLLNQTLNAKVPSGTPEVVFNAQTPLNTLSDWTTKFPSGGTATNPKLVRVINGGLNIPANAVLSNTIIKVDSGDINFNGSGQTFTNVVLVATNGNVNLNNANATDLSVFASGSINANGSAKVGGTSLFATGTSSGNITFNGSTKTVTGTDQLQVIAQGNITYNGSSDTRGSFLSVGTFTFNGSSSLYGSIGAKGDITFNGKTTVTWASIRPFNQAPTDLGLSPASIAENVLATSIVGTLSTTDPNPGNTFTYSLVSGTGSTDNAAFTIVGNQLKINASPDFESKSSYSIRVKTIDQDGLSYEKALTVSITDVNEAPTSLILSNSITPENVAAGSAIGTFTSTDPDANNTFTYSLVTGTGSTDNAAFTIVGNQLKINASPNFEAKSSYSILVRTTDQGGLSYDKALTIGITDVNEAPTSLVLNNNVTPENVAAGSVIGTLSTSDPDANNTFTYSLVTGVGSSDNAAFTIVGNQLKINTSPNFETKSSYSILVRTTDQGGLSYDKALVIGVTDVNEAPISLVLSNNITPENVAAGSVIGSFSSTDPDANNTFTYSLVTGTGDADNVAFSIVGNQLKINASPDFESKSSYSIRVRTIDQGGLSYEKTLAIAITDLNETPTSLVLSNSITAENVAAGSVIGSFASTDPDVNNTFTYSLVTGTGSTDNAAFSVVGNQLKINASPDFEAKSSYSVRVRTTDQGGLSFDQVFTVSVTDVNEVPTNLTLSNSVTPENVAAGSIIGSFASTDPDASNTFTYSLVAGTGATDNAAFSVVGDQLKINASPDFETKSSYSVRVRTTDQGGLSFDQVFTVSVTDVNEVPTSLVLSNNVTPENVAAGSVIGSFASTDPDANNTFTFTYSLVAGTGSTDNAAFSVVGNQLKINASPDFEAKSSYGVRVRTTDQGGLSFDQVFTVSITDVNEAPTNLTLSNSVTPENVAAGSAIGSFATTDPDANNTFTYSLVAGIGDVDNAAFSVVGNQLKISASPDFEAKSSYSVRVRTTDQGGLSYDKVFMVSITNVNEAPTQLQLTGNTVAENSILGTVIGQLGTQDPDAGDTFTYQLLDDAGGRFQIVGAQVQVKNGALLDFEQATSHSITVQTTDAGGLSTTQQFEIAITNTNEAPTDLGLNPSTTLENVAVGSTIGSFVTTDPDTSNTYSYSLVSGAGSTDNAAFSVVGNQLTLNASPDFEAQPSYSIRVRTTDQGGLSIEKALTISVSNVNEAPVSIALTQASVAENSVGGTVIGQLGTLDPDFGDTQQYTLTDSAGDRFELIGNTLQVKNGAVLDFETTPSLSIEVQSTDAGGLSTTQRFTIAISDVNEAPTLSAIADRILDEGSLVSFSTIATDPDQPSQSLTYSLESAPISGVNLDPTTGLFTWTPTEAQGPGSYSFAVKVSDGALSDTKTFSIQVAEVNVAPVLGAIADQQLLIGNTLTLQTTATDADLSANALTYSLDSGAPTGAAINPVTGVLSWTPTATGDFQLTVRVSDNGTPSLFDMQTIRVQVLSSNHAPTALALSPATIQENSPANSTIGTLSITDPDLGNAFTYSLVPGLGSKDNGAFTIIGNQLKINASPDYEAKSSYSIRVKTADQGGLSVERELAIAVTNVNEAPVFTSTLTGTATADVPYEYRITTADPENDARAITVAQLPAWMTLQDNGDGTANLSGTPSFTDAGLFTVNLSVTETATVEHLQASQKSYVGVGAVLKEQSNFAPDRILSLTIPVNPSILSFKINPLTFDLTDPKSINDAFEVALVDAQGKSLLPTLGTGRDSFFNWTEDLSAAISAGTTYDAATGIVRVNLTGIKAGTDAKLVFRLVNDDSDIVTQVSITDLSISDAPVGTVAPVVTGTGAAAGLTTGTIVDFNVLQDVTPSVEAQYQRTSFNDQTNLLYADVAFKNSGTYAVDTPLIVAVKNISDPSVQLRDPDGFTPEGLPYYNFSTLVADGKLEQGEVSNARSLVFYNPNELQFTYDLVVLAGINQAPVILSSPNKEVVAGDSYRYDVKAADANNDALTYKLLIAPDGMVISANTGVIEWQGTAGKVGSQSITIEVNDGRGGTTQQSFTLAVIDAPPNRPPNFTTTPVVDAYINQPYKYDSNAVDPDQDPLTYSLISGPQGMQVDPSTGLITWTPNGTQFGIYDVVLEVVDGNGGVAQQSFQIQTQAEPGNFAPIITSIPAVTAYTSKAYSYDVIAVDPDKDALTYALVNAPAGMTIDSASGKILWGLPIEGQSDVTVQVQDNRGGVNTQNFTLNVNNTLPAQVSGQVSLSNYQLTSQVVYYQNFEDTSNPLTEWSHPIKNTTPSGNRHFIGQYGGPVNGIDQGTSLTLNDLPEHDNINLFFKLFVIQSWDGYSPYNFGYIPDEWKLDVDGGQTLLFTSFDNAGRNNQIYPGQIVDGVSPTYRNYKEGAAESNTLGYSYYGDAVYDINISFAHSGTSLKLNFAGAGTTNLNDIESWGLDDVKLLAGSSSKGLQGWTTYVDENLNGTRDSGEISTKTDAQGKYSFTLSPGSHTIAEEVQPGWTQISPTTATYQVNLASGQSIQNLNFGNTNGRPNGATDNVAPAFISTPTTSAIARQTFRYEVSATDLNSDPLRYSLLVNPDGMVLDPETGSLSWRPTDSQIGVQDVVLQVKDPYGGVDVQSFQVNVSPYNTAPIFTTLPGYNTPLHPIAPGQVFQYQPITQDAENDRVSYRLASGPNGAIVDPNTGLLTWTASSDQIGQNPLFSITASDGHGGNTTQSFNVKVFDSSEVNAIPSISSQPRTQISVGRTYLYQLIAADSNNDPLTYNLESGSPGMFVDGKGILTWQPTPSQIGSHAVTLSVSDGRGGIVRQSFNIEVVNASSLINHAPFIASTPVLTTNANKLYQYNLNASDADNDVLFWALDKAPKGMSIDPKQGTLRWIPQSNQLGDNEVVVRVQDAQGGYSTQTFTLRVTGINAPPQITSTPDTRASVGQSYRYQIAATDPENNPLSFSLGQHPTGMLIDAVTGQISWNPDATQLGLQDVTVQVIDSEGAQATQKFIVQVGTTPINHAPEITSTPGLLADLGNPYRYQVQATDPDHNPLTYQLISAPQGMSIDPLTGLTQWLNPIAGTYQVVVSALDNGGLGAAQGFTLTAKANGLPVIQSTPAITATPGVEYKYDLQAKDPEGEALTYTLDSASQALGMTLDSLGRLRWTPSATQLGTKSVTLTVTDSAAAKVTQQFNLSVTADTEAPKVNLMGSTNIADIGDDLFFQALATDNIGIKNLQLFINNTPVAIDGNGLVQLKAQQPGTLTAKAIATDLAGNQTETTTTIQVRNPADTDAPQIDLDLSGITDGTITGPVAIKGSVSDTNLDYYVLEVAPLDGSAPFKEVFRGTGNVSNGTLGTFDPSLLLNDSYILRLSAFDTNGQGTKTEQTLSVAGELKLGNFRLSFTDLTIPVTGIPITLIRTYDSLTSNNTDDFGYGWRMEFRDTDLRTSLGKDETYEVFGIRTKAFDAKTRVYITLPGGKREGFTFKPTIDPISRFFPSVAGGDPTIYLPAFVADSGVTSTLSVQNVRMLRTAEGKFYGLSGNPYNPADALYGAAYTLTTKEGIVYDIDAQTGDLLKVTDTDGNTLTYTDFDVTSSTGQKVTFERDSDHRITSVTDPMGQKVKYAYNDKGDLIGVTDREGNTTQYEYDQAQAHYLDKIIDPLGRTGIKNEYDDKGRLSKTLDVNGKAIGYQYDLTQSTETVLDVFGKPTTFIYDDRGNVLQQIDAKGGITQWTYDKDNNLLSETDADGVRTQYTYNDRGDRLSIEDGDGHITRMTYNSKGQLETIVSPTGLTVSMQFTSTGKLRSSTDADGLTTTYYYYDKGKPSRQIGPDGQVTTWGYDAFGNPNQMVDSHGNAVNSLYDRNGRITTASSDLVLDGQTYSLSTSFTYDKEGRILSNTNAQGNTQSKEYNSLGQVVSTTDILGNVTRFEYDNKGQLIKVILPDNTPNNPNDNPTASKEYDAAGRVISQTSPTGLVTHYVYDELGRLVETILPDQTPDTLVDNPHTQTEYTAAGRVKAKTDLYGNREEYTYDALGHLKQVKDVLGNTTSYTYTIGGQLASITDPRNRTTQFFYDDKARLVETRFFDGASAKTTYDSLGRVQSDTNALGQKTQYEYDAYGQVKAVINALNERTEFEYDQRKNLVKVTDALGHFTTYTYDQYGRKTATNFETGDKILTGYDGYNRLTNLTDENNHTTQYTYDNLGALTGILQANQAQTSYTYDNLGRLTQIEDANHNKTTYELDAFSRTIATTLPMGQQSQTSFDKYGHISSTRDYNGDSIQYAYDNYGRLDHKSFSDARVATVSYTYDPVTSQLKTVTDGRGVTQYIYDNKDRLKTTIVPDGEFVAYGYDLLGNTTSLTTATGTTRYTYDALNRVDKVQNGSTLLADYDYDAAGNLIRKTLSDGTVETSQYDSRERLTQLQTKNVAGDIISGYQYTLDGVGNRTKVIESSGRTVDYTYDVLNRLTQEAIVDPSLGNRTTSYTFDLVGNRLSRNDSVAGQTLYSYDANNRLTQTTLGSVTTQFTYDSNGSLKQRTNGNSTTVYDWVNDGENRLMGVTTTQGGQTHQAQYVYDANGTRVASIIDGTRTNYLVSGSLPQVLMEYDDNGIILKDYSYGLGLIRTRTDGTEASATYYHQDGLGSTRILTNATGTVTDRYSYDAYGVKLSHAGTSTESHLFAGEQRDSATGLDYLRARYYDADLGRFISKDPFSGFITDPMSLHDYQYAHANPINNTDPTGYFTLSEFASSAAIAGILSSLGWSTAYAIESGEVHNVGDFFNLAGQWAVGFAEGATGGLSTDVLSLTTGEVVKPKNDFIWQMGFLAGASVTLLAAAATQSARVWVNVGREYWLTLSGGYSGGKGLGNIFKGEVTVWNILAVIGGIGLPFLGSASRQLSMWRAANRAGNSANEVGTEINTLLKSSTETRTYVGPDGNPSPAGAGDPPSAPPVGAPEPTPIAPEPAPGEPGWSPKSGCFIAGTQVLTPEGEKNIESIQVGDLVMADDPNTPGDIQARRVTQVFIHDVTTLIDLTIDGEVIATTEIHPFWVPGLGWVHAEDLQVGTRLQTEDGRIVDIDGVQKRYGNFKVYNFEVEGFNSYFVSDLGVLVHNTSSPWRGKPEILDGDPKKGWQHIDERHVTGNSPQGPGDLFAPGTTRQQIEDAARKVVSEGARLTDPSRRMQIFEDRITVNGMRDRVRVLVDALTGEVITIFPVRSE
jgi:RHS repeat-associated protein